MNDTIKRNPGTTAIARTFHTAALSHPNNSSTYIDKQRLRSTEGLQPGHGNDGLGVFFLYRGGFEEILEEEIRVEVVMTRWDDRHLAFSIDSALTDIQELYEKRVTASSHTNETVIKNMVRFEAEPEGANQHVRWGSKEQQRMKEVMLKGYSRRTIQTYFGHVRRYNLQRNK